MDKITVDSSVGNKLRELAGDAVIFDANGRVIGLFSPIHGQVRVEDLQLEPPLSIAETQALRKDRTGKPLDEIFERLGSAPPDHY